MLVLSRRVGERLLIGDDIVITVIEVRSDGVRLGIEAPREVRVHRAEVIEAVRLTNVEAGEASDATEAALRRLVGSGEPAGPGPASTPVPEPTSTPEPASTSEPESTPVPKPGPQAPRPAPPAPTGQDTAAKKVPKPGPPGRTRTRH